MEKKVITIMIAFVLILIGVTQTAQAVPASVSEMLQDKLVYHTEESDYESGDCILSATRVMIRRAGIMNNDSEWKDLTNAKLRPKATEDGLMHNSFSYKDDGITYSISTGTFEGKDKAARIQEFEKLVKAHPEGIVVYGAEAAETGPHGVLLVDVVDGVVYATIWATETSASRNGETLPCSTRPCAQTTGISARSVLAARLQFSRARAISSIR